ncbi:MarR family transcriptional regulator [Halobacteria archaeon AArc-m2/3/4]|uniref:MarR family transcriptional regulator n=1 Tax=Natronoglomus mannanivorans TaxID=2979990 RepID=A0AAP3E0Y8_9EURY|nr:MarR family transcriptional regulator [Halobacteria archaeon AArc-xg1-1]MCU4972783.1 MarR family transcriptional regulator [Halobacteria archaeon AArc-m2/3/4]
MLSHTTSDPLDDIEFLARSEHRVTALAALAEGPQSRADLQTLTGASASTIGRTLREFEHRRWSKRDGHRFEATQLGTFVASGLQDLLDRIETEHTLRDVWQWLPTEESGFTLEMGTDAVVTEATVTDPYGPVNRFVSLLRETDRFRFVGFDVALLEPCKDELSRRITGGMHTEIIDPPSVARYILSTYAEHCSEPLESGNLVVRLHDDLPSYGISLFDDRIGISGYNPDSGTVQVFLDTDAPVAREWAESTYDSYRRDARPLALETPVD